MVYSDPLVHLSETDSYVNYDLARVHGNETPSDWKKQIWDTLIHDLFVKQKINLLMIGGDICNMKIYLVSESLISPNYYPFKSAFIIINI